MATLLYRIGRAASRRAGAVIAVWIVLLAGAAAGFALLGGTLASTFEIPGTETDRVNAELQDELGSSGATGSVVFTSAESVALSPEQQTQISDALSEVTEIDGVTTVVDPFVTAQQGGEQQAQLTADIEENATNLATLTENQDGLTAALEQATAAGAPEADLAELTGQLEEIATQLAGLQVQAEQLDLAVQLGGYASGIRTISEDGSTALGVVVFEGSGIDVPLEVKDEVMQVLDAEAAGDGVQVDYSSEIAASIDGLVGPGEVIGLLVAAIVLLVMFRALRPAAVPVLSSLVGVGVAVAGSLAFSGVVDMSSVTPVLGLMLGLAVGIDYSLFILHRHRRQVRAGMDVHESIGLANGTAGNAVVFAGATVLVALLALNVSGIGFLGLMGTVGAVCVLVAVLVAITFTPALLGLLGDKVLRRAERGAHADTAVDEAEPAPMRTGRAVAAILVGVAALATVALPALSLRLGLPDGSAEPADSTQYTAYTTTQEQFGAGQNGPIVVTATLPEPMTPETTLPTQVDIAAALMDHPEVVAVAPAGVSEDQDFIAFQVVPVDGPSSETTETLVNELRASSPLDGDVELGVAGFASGNIDISERLADSLALYLVVVVGLSLLILVLVFRSLVVPLLATAGFVLSLVAALGAMTAVYQWGWLGAVFGVTQPGPVLNFAPLIITGVLFGLAMDYQLFLGSAIREAYVHGRPARAAVTAGVRQSRAVVMAAATIMIAVFGGFVFSHLTMVRPLGFGLAVGVLFDAFVVRLLLIPAALHLIGRGAWWLPRWLDRVLPDVDVEGAALERSRPAASPESPNHPDRTDQAAPGPERVDVSR